MVQYLTITLNIFYFIIVANSTVFQYPYQFGLRVLDKPKYIFYSIIFPSFITVFLSKIIITKFMSLASFLVCILSQLY